MAALIKYILSQIEPNLGAWYASLSVWEYHVVLDPGVTAELKFGPPGNVQVTQVRLFAGRGCRLEELNLKPTLQPLNPDVFKQGGAFSRACYDLYVRPSTFKSRNTDCIWHKETQAPEQQVLPLVHTSGLHKALCSLSYETLGPDVWETGTLVLSRRLTAGSVF